MLRRIVLRPRVLRVFSTATNTTVDNQEIEHFKSFTEEWWNEYGPMKPLHSMNKVRIPFIRDGLINTTAIEKNKINSPEPLKDLKILDIGCGGGILSEPLSRLGAVVTGIDANQEIIKLARTHADSRKLDITYISTSIEDYALSNSEKYDAIVASEILEHVTQKNEFIAACVKCLKPSGSIFITTINKTTLANIAALYLGEYIFRLLPAGTHQFEKFIEPHKLQRILEDNNCRTKLVHGLIYNPLRNNWSWCSDNSVNYSLHAVKLKVDSV